MAPQLKCYSCKIDIKNREFLKCITCKNVYDIDCAKVGIKLFLLKTRDRKDAWKCINCRNLITTGTTLGSTSTAESPIHKFEDQSDNITHRKPNQKKCLSNSFNDSSVLELENDCVNSSLMGDTRLSLPNLSSTDASELLVMKQEISSLTTQLASAHEEIDRLNLQVMNIQKVLEEQQRKVDLYKKLLLEETPLKSTPLRSNRRNSLRRDWNILPCNSSTAVPIQNMSQNDTAVVPLPDNQELKGRSQSGLAGSTLPSLSVKLESNPKICSKIPEKKFPEQKSRIIVLGDQESKNLASSLITLRAGRRNPKQYNISGLTYPEATCDYIIQNSGIMKENLSEEDWLILCIGSNECNPTKFIVELSALIKNKCKPRIIVTSIIRNAYLNEYKLNAHLATLLQVFPNCSFVDLSLCTGKSNRTIIPTCPHELINNVVNVKDYDKLYIRRGIMTKSIPSVKPNIKIKQRGSIPYYFEKIRLQAAAKSYDKVKLPTEKIKKTIPDYFKKRPILERSTFSHPSASTPHNKHTLVLQKDDKDMLFRD